MWIIESNRVSCTDDPSFSTTVAGRQAISDLSFSHDGEYLAIAGAGSYIDIVRPHLSYFLSLAVIQVVLYENSARRRRVCQCIVYLHWLARQR